MDLKTIAQQDFVKFDCDKVTSTKYERTDHSGVLKFTGVSNYQSEYPNWGHYEFISIKNPHVPFTNNSVKLDSVTTYSQNYCKNYEKAPVQTLRKIQVSNPLTVGGSYFPSSTSASTYKSFENHHFPERAKNKDFGIMVMDTSPLTYKSMYSSEFSLKDTPSLVPKKRDSIIQKL